MKRIAVLITHECSGQVREAFNAYSGVEAFSCDLKPAEDGRHDYHILGDAITAMRSRKWDLIGMHPPCTFLSSSGLHWNKRRPERAAKTARAIDDVLHCMWVAKEQAGAWYLENPIGCISTQVGSPTQIIQPHHFGEDASKATCLWLWNLPKLRDDPWEEWVKPRWVCGACGRVSADEEARCWNDQKGQPLCHRCEGTPRLAPRWANQTDSGQNRLGPSESRATNRARTYPKIAAAMAKQWVRSLTR